MEKPHSSNPRFAKILSGLLGEMEDPLIRLIQEKSNIRSFKTGEFLFRQGDTDNTLFIILTGRCRVLWEQGNDIQVLGDIAEGEPAGEFALFTAEPRSASVVAIRPSVLFEIKEDDYLAIISHYPSFANMITRFIITRLRRNILQQHLQAPPRNIAIINLQAENDITPWTEAVQKQFENMQLPIRVYTHEVYSDDDNQTLFESLEEKEGINFLVCSDAHLPWSRQCIMYADLVLVATDFNADSRLYPIEENLKLYHRNILNRKIYLLLLHQENAPLPENTRRWFVHRKTDLHIHLRKNHAPDTRRFCRIISNQAIGLVLGGGGAKGFAHIGAVKAMLKAGIEIDFLGGTSSGALYGIGMAYCDFDVSKIDYYSQHSAESKLTSNDFTLPLVSIMTGKKMTRYMKYMFGTTHLEDIWISTYCISTNYSTATLKIHERGAAWKQVEASIAIPGIFPPVVIDNHLHIDGGVMDNLPIEPMYRYPVKHIIAIALTGSTSFRVQFDDTPSAWTLLKNKLTGKKKYKLPGITSLLINSLTLNSRKKQDQYKSGVSIYAELDLRGVSLMDDGRWKEIMQKGYDQIQEHLKHITPEERFWQG